MRVCYKYYYVATSSTRYLHDDRTEMPTEVSAVLTLSPNKIMFKRMNRDVDTSPNQMFSTRMTRDADQVSAALTQLPARYFHEDGKKASQP